MFSKGLLVGTESVREFKFLREGLIDDFRPEGTLEILLVEKLAMIFWRNRRVLRAESAEINYAIQSPAKSSSDIAQILAAARRRAGMECAPKNEVSETNQNQFEEAAALVPALDISERLLRYETHLSREFDRTLSQLERLQRMRLGQTVPPPINVRLSG
jgi:hypothetical protein